MAIIGVVIIFNRSSEEAAESTLEKAIEKTTNGAADVDLDEGTVTINTNEGSFTATSGGNVELPDDFPSDIYIPDGTITSVTSNTGADSFSVSLESNDSVSQLKQEFETELNNDGWTITLSLVIQGGASIGAEKGNRSLSVTINEDEDNTFVILGTSTNPEE